MASMLQVTFFLSFMNHFITSMKMKHFLISALVLAGLLMQFNAGAQEAVRTQSGQKVNVNSDTKTLYEPDYKWEVRAGWGLLPWPNMLIFTASSLSHLGEDSEGDKDPVVLGDISIDAERKLNRWLAVGLDFSYDRMSSRSSSPSKDHIMDVLALMPCATANYLTRENVTLYGKVEAGAALVLTDCDSPDVLFAVQAAPIGVTFGHKFYGFAELSAGTLYIGGKLGVGFRF